MNLDTNYDKKETHDKIEFLKLTPQEMKIYKMYGRLPSTSQILISKLQEKNFFDSGDYAMENQLGGIFKTHARSVSMEHPDAEKVKEMVNKKSNNQKRHIRNTNSNLMQVNLSDTGLKNIDSNDNLNN